MARNTVSIVLYGNINTEPMAWQEWYKCALNLLNTIGFIPNYIGIKGEEFKSKKINKLDRIEKKVFSAFQNNTYISTMSFYYLPKNFTQSAFDYEVYLARNVLGNQPHIILITMEELFYTIDSEKIIETLKKHISFTSGEIFKMLKSETPLFYAAKVNPPSVFKSLEVIKEIK